jgi:hypothetical protein
MERSIIIGYKKPNNYVIDKENNIARIELKRRNKESLWTVIDLEDLQKVLNYPYSWHAYFNTHSKSWYVLASRYIKNPDGTHGNKNTYLNAYILNPEENPNICVDHTDHDTLDNRKCKLRRTETLYNTKNRKGRNSNNQTGYRNVSYIKRCKGLPYWVQIMINGKNKVVAKFADVDDAGEYAEKIRQKHYGDFAGES